eukprot:CAMPEP_0113699378 /NCGR_PEP_ID=MMETSP0038_2-20120614/23279_1 /TAXON_ID=2898 /ORGANISM="Cryptomonas paramecium" /LENGTH=85 /DNA_ID=CAMNT_0000622739 /DNA_START=795 /DNA_END=1053 /DNA_ORIENTATION=+ /assembly_acc=CAM_ASM_000170
MAQIEPLCSLVSDRNPNPDSCQGPSSSRHASCLLPVPLQSSPPSSGRFLPADSPYVMASSDAADSRSPLALTHPAAQQWAHGLQD